MKIILILPMIFLTSCAYLRDRGNDAMDIVTITGDLGIGGKVKVGPLATGLGVLLDVPSIRGGDVFINNGNGLSGCDFHAIFVGLTVQPSTSKIKYRNKSYMSNVTVFIDIPEREENQPLISPSYTQAEIGAAALIGGRIGFNVGELLDFLLGWFGVDIYNDDKAIDLPLNRPNPNPKTIDKRGGNLALFNEYNPIYNIDNGEFPLVDTDVNSWITTNCLTSR